MRLVLALIGTGMLCGAFAVLRAWPGRSFLEIGYPLGMALTVTGGILAIAAVWWPQLSAWLS